MYYYSLVLLAVFAVSVEAGNKPLIYGGYDADITEYPFMVYLTTSYADVCAGAIITPRMVLTAAHCTSDKLKPKDYYIIYGLTTLDAYSNRITAKKIVVHPDYNRATYDFDFAVIILESEIPFSSNAGKISITLKRPPLGADAIILGWGKTESEARASSLKSTDLNIISRTECQRIYAPKRVTITDRMICATAPKRSACYGDSGGPLVVDGRVAGVTSWGHGCGDTIFPSVFSNVAAVRDWLFVIISRM